MNNSEWIKLLRKQREREEIARKNKEVANNESTINNGDRNNNGSDKSNETGGEGHSDTKSPELDNIGGNGETGSSDNGDVE